MDFASQVLRAGGDEAELDKIIQQECRRKAASKLAATLSNPRFRFPTLLSAEQCTSDSLARLHASWIEPGSSVADLTCGLGIDSIHMARRAASVLAMDINPKVAAALEHNAAALGLENLHAITADCTEWLANCTERFNLLFIDPARRDTNGRRTYSLADCTPNVLELLPMMERIAPRVLIKMSPMLDPAKLLGKLPHMTHLHVVGTPAECKELVAEVDFGSSQPPQIEINTDGKTLCSDFSAKQQPTCSKTPQPGDILAEPWPAVAKAAQYFELPGQKLSANTSLWLNPDEDFPGKLYKVERVEPFSASTLKRLGRQKPEGSVATRNFPLTADELRRRLHASESSRRRIIGTTAATQRMLIFVTPHEQ